MSSASHYYFLFIGCQGRGLSVFVLEGGEDQAQWTPCHHQALSPALGDLGRWWDFRKARWFSWVISDTKVRGAGSRLEHLCEADTLGQLWPLEETRTWTCKQDVRWTPHVTAITLQCGMGSNQCTTLPAPKVAGKTMDPPFQGVSLNNLHLPHCTEASGRLNRHNFHKSPWESLKLWPDL